MVGDSQNSCKRGKSHHHGRGMLKRKSLLRMHDLALYCCYLLACVMYIYSTRDKEQGWVREKKIHPIVHIPENICHGNLAVVVTELCHCTSLI